MNELERIAELGFRIELIYALRTEKQGGNVWVIRLRKSHETGADLEDANLLSLLGRALSIANTLVG